MVELSELKNGQMLYYYDPYHNMILKFRVRGTSDDAGVVFTDGMGAIPRQLLFKSRKQLVRGWMIQLLRDKEIYSQKLKWTEIALENIKQLVRDEESKPETICENCLNSCKGFDVMACEGYKPKEGVK